MNLWFKAIDLDQIKNAEHGSMSETLGFEIVDLGDDFLKGKLPVDHRTKQPYGLLHGGANAFLAETLGSIAANLVLDPTRFYAVGVSLHTHHLRAVERGYVWGKATPLRIGNTLHVWEIAITNDDEELTSQAQLTMAVKKKR